MLLKMLLALAVLWGVTSAGPVATFVLLTNDNVRSSTHPAMAIVDIYQRAEFRLVDGIATQASEQSSIVDLPFERMQACAPADVIVLMPRVPAAIPALKANPLYQRLPAV